MLAPRRPTRSYFGLLLLLVFIIYIAFFRNHGYLSDPARQPHLKAPSDERVNGEPTLITPPSKNVLDVEPGFQPRVNATFVTLARNSDLYELVQSIREVEDRFNKNFHYDWVFLNDDDFDDEFKRVTSKLVSGEARFGKIPAHHWSYPPWISAGRAAKAREAMRTVIYGDSISYRHMCRFESGFFFKHPLLEQYSYYWRVEPEVRFFCDMPYDPFRFMIENEKKYGFVISLREYAETIPTLWKSVKAFMGEFPEYIHANNSLEFISSDDGNTYNLCHFWSNFEIGSLDWFRSEEYTAFFNFLDREGGFFYERWGDAPVHSIAASLLLDKKELHFFDDVGYHHVPLTHCPNDPIKREELRCSCNPKNNFDWDGYSCLSRYFDSTGNERPQGYEKIEPAHPGEFSP